MALLSPEGLGRVTGTPPASLPVSSSPLQAIVNKLWLGFDLQAAIKAPILHVDSKGQVEFEPSFSQVRQTPPSLPSEPGGWGPQLLYALGQVSTHLQGLCEGPQTGKHGDQISRQGTRPLRHQCLVGPDVPSSADAPSQT